MKRNLTRIALVLGGLSSASAGGAGVVAGCSSGNETTPLPEGGSDVTTADAIPDVHVQEAAADVTDAATSDVSDSSDFADVGDVQIDVPPLVDFPHAVDEAYCARLKTCCNLQPGQQWNQDGVNGCATLFDTYGGAFNIAGFNAALGHGLVAYDASAAYTCLQEWSSFNCGTISAASLDKVKSDCFGAMSGTVGTGADAGPCLNSLECQPGAYCTNVFSDAATGACRPLKGQGNQCGDTINSFDCTYLGNGNPSLYCAVQDSGAGACEPTLPNGNTGCSSNSQCQSGICYSPACVTTLVFSDPGKAGGTCASFTITDAGGGG